MKASGGDAEKFSFARKVVESVTGNPEKVCLILVDTWGVPEIMDWSLAKLLFHREYHDKQEDLEGQF